MVAEVRRFDVFLVALDPTVGAEIQKPRPCLIVSPNEINGHLRTVIVAPMTSVRRAYPTRVDVVFQRKSGQVALDQLRTVDRTRLVKALGRLQDASAREVADILVRMFAFG